MKKWLIVILVAVLIFISYSLGKNQNIDQRNNITVAACTRQIPYSIAPEFERSLSLIKQRMTISQEENFFNCIDIQYSNLNKNGESGTQGVFVFDKNNSSPDHMLILVDNSYRNYDDLTTASLLAHELMHANQFLRFKFENKNLSCVEMETEAFLSQWNFLGSLNQEEMRSISSKVPNTWKALDSMSDPYQIIWNLVVNSRNARTKCNPANKTQISEADKSCYFSELKRITEDMIKNSPVYKEQCNL